MSNKHELRLLTTEREVERRVAQSATILQAKREEIAKVAGRYHREIP